MKTFILLLLGAYLLLTACSGNKTYTVSEFSDLYKKNKHSLKGQTVVIEGFYKPYAEVSGNLSGIDRALYLFEDGQNRFKNDIIVFMLKNTKIEPAYPQKIKITGKVSANDFTGRPLIIDAEIIEGETKFIIKKEARENDSALPIPIINDTTTYTVEEFTALYKKYKQILKGKTVVIKGNFRNVDHRYAESNGITTSDYLIFYFFTNDKKFPNRVLFITKKGQIKPGYPQELKMTGKVGNEEFENYPIITDAEILK